MLEWRLSASKLCGWILRSMFYYAALFGAISFSLRADGNGLLVARHLSWAQWSCLVTRLLGCGCYWYLSCSELPADAFLKLLTIIQVTSSLVCDFCIIALQLWYGKQVLRVLNRFLRLFRRLRALTGQRGFGGSTELVLLLLKALCMCFDLCYAWPLMLALENPSARDWLHMLSEVYTIIGANIVIHICFLAYLSVGALYAEINSYVSQELRRQLRWLERRSAFGQLPRRRQVKAIGGRLDECVAIYDEIERVGGLFHKLLELPLCLSMLHHIFGLTLVSYFVIMKTRFSSPAMCWLVAKIFLEVLLLTLAAHSAVSNSRVVRRLSLENYYVKGQCDEWHKKLEMFLGRLNFFEFRVRPLGLFEVSNGLVLLVLSGMVTYLTYIVQSGMQSRQL